ncbi:MAG: hypothetical protein DRO00_02665 [Thermoproteota archaeon]|nr:MAG: hypothetical protein DRO00_02665 [Candidatus Korarchaeota archaeon]
MKVAVYYSLEDLRVEERPVPAISSGEILVEMRACGICGSDLMSWYLKDRAPLVLGHEPSGVVVRAEEGSNFSVGDRVFVHHHVSCMSCYYCTHQDFTMCEQFRETHLDPGGFAEFFRVPAPNVQFDTLKLPEDMSFEEATLIEPLGCCIRALNKCDLELGDVVAVIGAGPAGIMLGLLSKLKGASKVITCDLVDYRVRKAIELVGPAINPLKGDFVEKVKEESNGRGADIVFLTVSSPKAFRTALNACRKGGTISLFAPTSPKEFVEISPHDLFFKEISIIPSYSTSHIETREALSLLSSKRIDASKIITHRFSLDDVGKAFELAAETKECLKVLITVEKP